jgi:hypothetical protein
VDTIVWRREEPAEPHDRLVYRVETPATVASVWRLLAARCRSRLYRALGSPSPASGSMLAWSRM